MRNSLLPPLRSAIFPVAIAVLSLTVAVAGEGALAALRYERDAMATGEIWRVITAHFTHLGWSHLGLNLAGLVLIWLLVGAAFSFMRWGVVFVVAALGTSAGLWWLEPQLHWYVGLSGVLHGLLIAGALASLGTYKDAPLLLGLVVVKLVWEQWMGPMPGSEAAAGGPVVVASHTYGAVGGLVAWLLLRVSRFRDG